MIRSATIVRTISIACIMLVVVQVEGTITSCIEALSLKSGGCSVGRISAYEWLDALNNEKLLTAYVDHEKQYGAWPTHINDFAIEDRYTTAIDWHFNRDVTIFAKLHPLRRAIRKGWHKSIMILAMHPHIDLDDGLHYARIYRHKHPNDLKIGQTIAILKAALYKKHKSRSMLDILSDTCTIS